MAMYDSKERIQKIYDRAMFDLGEDPVESLGRTVKIVEDSSKLGNIDEWHPQLLSLFEMVGYIDPSDYEPYRGLLEFADSYFFGETKRYENLERPDPLTLKILADHSPYKDQILRFLSFYSDRWMDLEEAAEDEIKEYWNKQDELLADELGISLEINETGFLDSYRDQIDELVTIIEATPNDKTIDIAWGESYSFLDNPSKRNTRILYSKEMKDNPYFASVLGRRLFEMILEANLVTIFIREKTDERPEFYGFYAGDMLTPLPEGKLKEEASRLEMDFGSLDDYEIKMVSVEEE